MFRKLHNLCLIVLITKFHVYGNQTTCWRSGLKQISDIKKDVCNDYADPQICTRISLSYNNIRVIKSLDFENYHKLESLFLSENKIYYVEHDAFRNTVLRFLTLNTNMLSCIPNLSAVAATLDKLWLSGNLRMMEDCPDGNFSTSPYKHNLTELRLAATNLTRVPNFVLNTIKGYTFLVLQQNNFASLPDLSKVMNLNVKHKLLIGRYSGICEVQLCWIHKVTTPLKEPHVYKKKCPFILDESTCKITTDIALPDITTTISGSLKTISGPIETPSK